MGNYMRVEVLQVYQKLCQLHIEICDLPGKWPAEERCESGSQIRRSSNSSPVNLAEKHSDRHVRNKIEGVNRAHGEAMETVHHLCIAKLKGHETDSVYQTFPQRCEECVRMLNGLEKKLESQPPESERRWPADDSKGS